MVENPQAGVETPRLDWVPLIVAIAILDANRIACLIGAEAAFAYYNSLVGDFTDEKQPVFEIIVDAPSYATAPGILVASGLFNVEPSPPESDFDGGWRKRQGFPHIKTNGWCSREPRVLVIVPDDRAGILVQASGACVGPEDGLDGNSFNISPQLRQLSHYQISMLPFPPLKVLVNSLPRRLGCGQYALEKRVWDEEDDPNFTRALLCARLDNLVDGMDIDVPWAIATLRNHNRPYYELLREVIEAGRLVRHDDDYQYITSRITTPAEAEYFRNIPGR
ncbi:hypothetical protein CDD80_510 [Ophiocordyceps camponoti-rufipedis]|uniref:Uncharacterized protein n=1 Tax=Ophiocordyceps camponoti-rufipedis TaxID=2004952 RepID=A0A2C5ZCD4_9HYPO|nr:hypothetical protein CDD80_510 [Ophiocordyceps camponoti-rufipedis]